MINPEVYNDVELMHDWFNYRTHNVVSHNLYRIMGSIDREMVGIEEGVKDMVKGNWCRIMDENLKVALAKEKGRVAGEKVSNAIIRGAKIIGKWIRRAIITGVLVAIGVVAFNHWYDGYKEIRSNSVVYQLGKMDDTHY